MTNPIRDEQINSERFEGEAVYFYAFERTDGPYWDTATYGYMYDVICPRAQDMFYEDTTLTARDALFEAVAFDFFTAIPQDGNLF